MAQHRFDVFGRLVVITGIPGNWSAFRLGEDGLRHAAEFSVPPYLGEGDLRHYLTELFRDSASRTQPVVKRIEPRALEAWRAEPNLT